MQVSNVDSTQRVSFTLELTVRELQLLHALVDFPYWEDQPVHIADFLVELSGELYEIRDNADLSYETSASGSDYVATVSFG